MRTFLVTSCLLASSVIAQEKRTYLSPGDAATNPDFAVQGEYVGPTRAMQVVALGDGEFDAVIYAGGLPGAGWDKQTPKRVEADASLVAELASSNQMKRVDRQSPTLGMGPPDGAVNLFDGNQGTFEKHWKPGAKITQDGLLEQGATSVQVFQDFRLHLEFRTPFMPDARGQGRGNSGVYFQGRYETQVLDSFGLIGKMNEAGGIYSIRDPDLNMCLPPLAWQTYDADFVAAKFDQTGNKVSDARLTVRLNGVVVQQDVSLTHATTAAPVQESAQPGPIFLQNHGNPVRFRNIWVVPRDAAKEARRPIVPGYERFFASGDEADPLGGRLLIGELGCISCHQATPQESANWTIATKQAPILTNVGSRIRPDYIFEYLSNPHATKPGTTMPEVLGKLSYAERHDAAEALTNFLLSTGSTLDRGGHPKSAARGKEIFHSIGCTACHAPQYGMATPQSTTVPLGRIAEKYTIDSLTVFLQNPHSVRPSGRMPSLLKGEDASDVATYLLRDTVLGDAITNVQATFYQGNWDKLPNFDELTPVQETTTYGLDIRAYREKNLEQFAARFDTFFNAPQDAQYRFHLGSDDGSKLFIDGNLLIDADGIHPVQRKSASLQLTSGIHSVRVEYFEKGGGEELELEIEGGGIKRMPFEAVATLDRTDNPPKESVDQKFALNPNLVANGREFFSNLGCANCHQLQEAGARLASTKSAPSFAELRENTGCLAEAAPIGTPDYELTVNQRQDIQAAMVAMRGGGATFGDTKLGDAELVHATMAAMNCYACHSRGGLGGPETTRDAIFKTTMKEMGDEGRIPPPLDGVGDKLKSEYIATILSEGANERSYMLVSMPGFGPQTLDALSAALVRTDQRSAAVIQRADGTEEQVKASGRLLAGTKGLSCIQCHTAGGKGSGIRAIDMQRMTTRLREDWFHRYLMVPTKYRPGTRMPSSFPDGKSVLPKLYDGVPSKQIDALWQYLSEGAGARLPIGAEPQLIELTAAERPVIYRNFIEGLSPRGIGVGYPEGGNIAWDANTMSLAQVWRGSFIDASKHWVGRGPGNQTPLGDQILALEKYTPIAQLKSAESPWPAKSGRELGYRFLGYHLNALGQPTFRYRLGAVEVEDTPVPIIETTGVAMRRELKLTGTATDMFVRVAIGTVIAQQAQGFEIDGQYSVELTGVTPQVVAIDGKSELRQAVDLSSGSATIVQTIRW